MKRKLILFLCVVLCLTALFSFSACGEAQKNCEHVYGVSDTEEFFEKDGKVYSTKVKCNLCGEFKEVAGAKIVDSSQVYEDIANAKDNALLFLKEDIYSDVLVYTTAKNLHLVFEEGAVVIKLTLISKMENLTIDGASFEGHLIIADEMDGLTIKNCEFRFKSQISTSSDISSDSSKWIKNLVIDNCSFTNISEGTGGKLTAIRVANIENLTLTNCVFENVDYNCLQVPGGRAPSEQNPEGVPSIKGDIKITGNTFKSSGVSPLNLHRIHPTSCDISSNVFYKHKYYLDTDTGAYGVVIGVNTWEEIPEGNDTQFNGWDDGRYIYDATEQILLQE